MRAIVLGENGLEYDPDYAPKTIPGEVEVDVLQSGICETDLQLVGGYMQYRGVLGHEFVGVAKTGPLAGQRVVGEINCGCLNCEDCHSGRGNHCASRTVIGILGHDGAFADHVWVPSSNLHAVPQQVTDDQATLVEPLAAAFQIPAQVDLRQYAQVVVVGDGRLGYLCAQVLKSHGCRVTVVGKHERKLQRFRELGMETVDAEETPRNRFADLAVDCCGANAGVEAALKWLRPRGTLILKTTVQRPHQLWLASVVIDEIQVLGSRCGPFDVALKALADARIEVDSMITARYPLNRGLEAFQAAEQPSNMKVILQIRDRDV